MTTTDRRHFFDQLRSRLRLSEIVSRQVKLTRRGREHTGLCPFHSEKTPSFTVNDQKSFYHCFGCGAHGDALKFLMEIEKYTYKEALEELASKAGLEVPTFSREGLSPSNDKSQLEIVEEATLFFEKALETSSGAFAREYLKKRGILTQTISKFRLGYSPDTWSGLIDYLKSKKFDAKDIVELGLAINPDSGKAPYDRFRGRLMFPIFNFQDKPVAFGGRILGQGDPKYLNSPENPLFHKGALLFNFANARNSKAIPLLIVEGYMDVIALDQSGYPAAVAPMGTALTKEQIQLAWRLDPEPIVCFDGDMAGQKAAIRAAERVLPILRPGHTLKFAFLPKGQDPDSLLRTGQKETFDKLISSPLPLVDLLWKTLTPPQDRITPEVLALLERRIDEELNKIIDPTLKQYFRNDLRGRFFAEYSHKNRKNNKSTEISKKTNKNLNLNSVSQFYTIQQQILLATLIQHPHIIGEVIELLADLEIYDEAMNALREDLLRWQSPEGEETVEGLAVYLMQHGHQGLIKTLTSESILMHGRFARKSASDTDALEGWQEVYYHHLERKRLEKELEIATQALAENPTPMVWGQVRALKEELNQLSQKE